MKQREPRGSVYHYPEDYGLKIFEEGDASTGDYQFDKMVVFQDTATGELFYAQDSGCSCPSPFDEYRSRETLTRLTPQGLEAFEQESRRYFDRQEQDSVRTRVRYVRAIEKVRNQNNESETTT